MMNKDNLPNLILLLANAPNIIERNDDEFDWDNAIVSQNYDELKIEIKKSICPQPLIIQ